MQLDLLDDWAAEQIEMPPRSRMYSRLPHGHGTALQESLISYLINAAKAHTLPPRILIEREIIPLGRIQYESRESSGFYSYYTRTINFHSKYAEEVSKALNQLTGLSCLAQTTFLPWGDILAPRGGGLLHRHPRWCHVCLSKRRAAELEPYFPLLWYVFLVEHCPEHGCALESECPHCHRTQRFIPQHYHIDHCMHCGAWLGRSPTEKAKSEHPDPFAQYAVKAISEMIQDNSRASTYANFERFQQRVLDYKRLVGDGSVSGLARKVGLQDMVISQWLQKGRRPHIKNLLQFTYRLQTSPVRLLRDEMPKEIQELPDRESQSKRRTQRNLSPEDKGLLETKLQAYVDRDGLPPTMREIAAELGQTTGFLEYRFGALCRSITDKRREMYKEKKKAMEREIEKKSYELTRALLQSGCRASRRVIENTLQAHKMSMLQPAARSGVGRAKKEFFSTSDDKPVPDA